MRKPPDPLRKEKRRLENTLRRYRRLWRGVQYKPGQSSQDRKRYYAAMCERYYRELKALCL